MPPTILLVSQAFPPDSVVGALRAGNVALAYRDAGYRVIVVTAAMAGETATERDWLPGVRVKTVRLGPRYRDRLTAFVRKWQPRSSMESASTTRGVGHSSRSAGPSGGRLRSLILSLVWIPDDELRFVLPAYRAARRLLDGVDLVYTTAPSHSTNLVGLLLRRLHRIRWCAEFRDPWCYPHSSPVTPLVARVNRFLERLCINAADHLVTVTEQTAALYRRRLGALANKVVLVRNGIPALNPRPAPARSATSHVRGHEGEPFRILYSGSIYGGRDPRGFLQAVRGVASEYAAARRPLTVDLFVSEPWIGGVSLESYIRGLGLADAVRVREWVPHAEMQRLLADADLLLLLAQSQPLQVPNKLYEYLGTGVPILAVADAEGETARMLHDVGGHFVVEHDTPDEIAAALRSALVAAGETSVPTRSRALLEEWLTERQMQRLVASVHP
jgi:glycosyltransferase involved in cell wall biosynthesis